MDPRPEQLSPIGGNRMPAWRFAARGLWIALRLVAVFYLGRSGERFFYQGF